jgi:hypothetical protein
LNTGTIEHIKKIDYSWIENINIVNDTVYFLYRRRDKNSAKYLYFDTFLKSTAKK